MGCHGKPAVEIRAAIEDGLARSAATVGCRDCVPAAALVGLFCVVGRGMTKIVTRLIHLPCKVLHRFYTTEDWLRLVRQKRKRMEHRERLCLMAQDSERACVAGDKASERFSAGGVGEC